MTGRARPNPARASRGGSRVPGREDGRPQRALAAVSRFGREALGTLGIMGAFVAFGLGWAVLEAEGAERARPAPGSPIVSASGESSECWVVGSDPTPYLAGRGGAGDESRARSEAGRPEK